MVAATRFGASQFSVLQTFASRPRTFAFPECRGGVWRSRATSGLEGHGSQWADDDAQLGIPICSWASIRRTVPSNRRPPIRGFMA